MQPVLTPAEMRALDAAALDSGVGLQALIDRAGYAVAVTARKMLAGVAGARIVVVTGPGNNGADGVSAARVLRGWGAAVTEVGLDALDTADRDGRDVAVLPRLPGGAEPALVIDAAFGTGYRVGDDRRPFAFPEVGTTPVLAVDIASGIDGATGRSFGTPGRAAATVTFVAPKPGNLLADGRLLGGELHVVDLGFASLGAPTPPTSIHHLEAGEGAARWPTRHPEAHKWRSAVLLVGGSQGMSGAMALAASAAGRAGAGHVSVGMLDPAGHHRLPVDVVARTIDPGARWRDELVDLLGRAGAIAIGPGLATDDATQTMAASIIEATDAPMVIDAGALDVIAARPDLLGKRSRTSAVGAVLTPHDGEFERLMGERPGVDRIAAARALASRFDAVGLLKGPTTIVAHPDGEVRLITSGDERLATAGSGDVLTGVIAAGLAQGLAPIDAAAFGAHVHGESCSLAQSTGTVASDLPSLVSLTLS